jgi:hypothetical protein
VRTPGYRDDFLLKVMAAAQFGDPALHVRADLEVVDAAERDLTPEALAVLRLPG